MNAGKGSDLPRWSEGIADYKRLIFRNLAVAMVIRTIEGGIDRYRSVHYALNVTGVVAVLVTTQARFYSPGVIIKCHLHALPRYPALNHDLRFAIG